MPALASLFAVTVDCPDPYELARFYQAFAGGELASSNDDFVTLSGGAVRIDFQRVANLADRWPDDDAPRRVHLDFRVDDLDRAEEELRRLGATVAEYQPGGRRFRVLFDPAGHPFCIADAATQY
jgi:Glyoxalase-like domain